MKAAKENKLGLVHSLLFDQSQDHEEFVTREPLVLNGHSGSPITSLAFNDDGTTTTLASGSSVGTVILWDVIKKLDCLDFWDTLRRFQTYHSYQGVPNFNRLAVLLHLPLMGLSKYGIWMRNVVCKQLLIMGGKSCVPQR